MAFWLIGSGAAIPKWHSDISPLTCRSRREADTEGCGKVLTRIYDVDDPTGFLPHRDGTASLRGGSAYDVHCTNVGGEVLLPLDSPFSRTAERGLRCPGDGVARVGWMSLGLSRTGGEIRRISISIPRLSVGPMATTHEMHFCNGMIGGNRDCHESVWTFQIEF